MLSPHLFWKTFLASPARYSSGGWGGGGGNVSQGLLCVWDVGEQGGIFRPGGGLGAGVSTLF